MVTSDLIAIGILIFCVALGVLGAFKWLSRLLTGAVFGLLILVCIGLLSDNPRFDKVSRGVFKDGVMIPYIKNRVSFMEEFISHMREAPHDNIAKSASEQKASQPLEERS